MSKANEEKSDAGKDREVVEYTADAMKIAVTGNIADMLSNTVLVQSHAQRQLVNSTSQARYLNDPEFQLRYYKLANDAVSEAFGSAAVLMESVKGEKGKFGRVDATMFNTAINMVSEITGSAPSSGGSKLGGLLSGGVKKVGQD